MKWLLAGLCFALLVGLAVGTAAVQATNVQLRARIQQQVDAADAERVALQAERVRFGRETEPARLVAYWLELQERDRP